MALLDVRNLSVSFGAVAAVADVSLSVESGTLVGLIGSNGAGKTTALDALTGFVEASGSARVRRHRVAPPTRAQTDGARDQPDLAVN